MKFFERIVRFISEARVELKKVVWPTREATIRHTLTIIVMSAVLALFLGGLDYVFQVLLQKFLL